MRKNGYTLAEVLITLGVVGVIAALTVGTLHFTSASKQVATKVVAASNVLNNASTAMLTAKGVHSVSEGWGSANNGFDYNGYLNDLSQQLITKSINLADLLLPQPAYAAVGATDECCNWCINGGDVYQSQGNPEIMAVSGSNSMVGGVSYNDNGGSSNNASTSNGSNMPSGCNCSLCGGSGGVGGGGGGGSNNNNTHSGGNGNNNNNDCSTQEYGSTRYTTIIMNATVGQNGTLTTTCFKEWYDRCNYPNLGNRHYDNIDCPCSAPQITLGDFQGCASGSCTATVTGINICPQIKTYKINGKSIYLYGTFQNNVTLNRADMTDEQAGNCLQPNCVQSDESKQCQINANTWGIQYKNIDTNNCGACNPQYTTCTLAADGNQGEDEEVERQDFNCQETCGPCVDNQKNCREICDGTVNRTWSASCNGTDADDFDYDDTDYTGPDNIPSISLNQIPDYTADNSILNSNGARYSFIYNGIPNDASDELKNAPPSQQMIGYVWIDIDDDKGQNQIGQDRFVFSWYNDGSIRPVGSRNWDGAKKNSVTWRGNCGNGTRPVGDAAKACAGSIFENKNKVIYKM